jgi:hypothetical protein
VMFVLAMFAGFLLTDVFVQSDSARPGDARAPV